MKRILLLFLVIIGIFIVFAKVDYRSWIPFGKHTSEAADTSQTDMIYIDVSGVNAKIVPVNRDTLQAELNGTGKVAMGSGNFNLKNLTINHLDHNGSSGNAKIESITTKDGSFEISSGNVNVKHYNGKLKTVLSSGNFKAQLDQLKNSVAVEVSSGNVQLDLPQNADFTLNGKISSGIISNDFLLKNEKRDRRYLQGIHGSGKYPVNLSVSSGRIKIY